MIAERERLPRGHPYDRGRRIRARVVISPIDNGRTLGRSLPEILRLMRDVDSIDDTGSDDE
jgi:hypothetical protein